MQIVFCVLHTFDHIAISRMADVSHVSMSVDTPNKGKSRPRHDKNRRAFSLVSPGGKDVHSAIVAGLSRENVGGRATPTKEKKRHKAKKNLESTSAGAADSGVAQEASDLLPTLPGSKTSRKGKGKAIKDVDPLTEQIEEDKLPFLRLSEPLGKSARLPPVFSQDGR